jgi:hypothetical protein
MLMPNKKNKAEATTIQKILMRVSSFKTFCDSTEVFDMNKRTMITKRNNLFDLYSHGIGIDSPVFIITKN